MKLASKSVDEAQKIIRQIDPKSRFMFTRLPPPLVEEVDEQKRVKKFQKRIIIDKEGVTA